MTDGDDLKFIKEPASGAEQDKGDNDNINSSTSNLNINTYQKSDDDIWQKLALYYLARIQGGSSKQNVLPTNICKTKLDNIKQDFVNLRQKIFTHITENVFPVTSQPQDDTKTLPPEDVANFVAVGYEQGIQDGVNNLLDSLEFGVYLGLLEKNGNTFRFAQNITGVASHHTKEPKKKRGKKRQLKKIVRRKEAYKKKKNNSMSLSTSDAMQSNSQKYKDKSRSSGAKKIVIKENEDSDISNEDDYTFYDSNCSSTEASSHCFDLGSREQSTTALEKDKIPLKKHKFNSGESSNFNEATETESSLSMINYLPGPSTRHRKRTFNTIKGRKNYKRWSDSEEDEEENDTYCNLLEISSDCLCTDCRKQKKYILYNQHKN